MVPIEKTNKKIFIVVFGLILVLLISGILYQAISAKIVEKHYPIFGRLVDVGGFRLSIYCTGNTNLAQKGMNKKLMPTVILDAGLGYDATEWLWVQPNIAKFARVCSYDRAGYGLSDAGFKPRTSNKIVTELHALLTNANVLPPYILVGHSFGGVNMQIFAKQYPKEVVGLVLVDSGHEKILEKLPQEPPESLIKRIFSDSPLNLWAAKFGLLHYWLQITSAEQPFAVLPKIWQKFFIIHNSLVKTVQATNQEGTNFLENVAELTQVQPNFGKLPLIVIAAGKTKDLQSMSPKWREYFQKFYPAWLILQKDLATRSTKGKLLIAKNSEHMIPWQQPEIIVNAVWTLVKGSNFVFHLVPTNI